MILGPTGTGKSDLGLAAAERLGGEIVGCDALQVYSGFDKATAKPSAEARARVVHHLVDCVDPRRDFSLAEYARLAERAISEIRSRGNVPIVVGGTGLYLRGLLRGVVEAPGRDPELRDRLRRMSERFGVPRMHRWLRSLDRESAERLPVGDRQRILRALEIAIRGDATWSRMLREAGTWSGGPERFASVKVGLDLDPLVLARRLDRRVERFFEDGLVEEVQSLLRAGIPAEANAFKAIGYRDVLEAILRRSDPQRTIGGVQRNTRRYAKRQRTWFRREPGVVWLDASTSRSALCDEIVRLWQAGTG